MIDTRDMRLALFLALLDPTPAAMNARARKLRQRRRDAYDVGPAPGTHPQGWRVRLTVDPASDPDLVADIIEHWASGS